MSTGKDDGYTVGYGKPPVATRFQAGRSGNPKGRPKGSLSLSAALNRAIKEKVVVVEGGQRKTITKLDATVKALVNRAVKGDARAVQQMLALAPLIGFEPATTTTALDANDATIMAGIAARLGLTFEPTGS